MDIKSYIISRLFELQDEKYRDFHSKLMPTINKDSIIGVRTPLLRKLAKELSKHEDIAIFLNELPHQYYEENNLHAFLIESEKDFDRCVEMLNKFLPYVDNWATCDMMRPKSFANNKDKLISYIHTWLSSNDSYAVRFGIECLMIYYLDEDFHTEYMEKVSEISTNEYYIKMMIAWYFATALAKQYETAVKYLENNRLEVWTHNKTIQKAIESYRISNEQKEYLKTLKRKES